MAALIPLLLLALVAALAAYAPGDPARCACASVCEGTL